MKNILFLSVWFVLSCLTVNAQPYRGEKLSRGLVGIPTEEGMYRQYRLAIAWQNVAYNQPPHTSY